ncbi:N-acetyltransferase GCN5 [Tritrichomonas foetus]|uniref:N-acetyltransferase GCN5 n=1 Tax=Tritrichomonas foetus TaxID=1144522 RepID=A0A1J4KSZ0_9EUKA|nr:N-acetyltransferase GCN5 [Tritrichomonas foetus]|eukprot:OHT14371.1 N-acetyltransferase GCN5 [Tritrichomonas foetus]
MNESYQVCNIQREEIPDFLRLCHDEGWSPTYEMIESFYKFDKEGLFVGKINGEIVSAIAAIKYRQNYGHISYFVVSKNHRGSGLGSKLFSHAFEHLNGNIVGLNAVESMITKYENIGFKKQYYVEKIVGISKATANFDALILSNVFNFDASMLIENKITDYFLTDRKEMLLFWLTLPSAITKVYINDGKIQGFASIHQKHKENAWEISPIISDNMEIAKLLIVCLMNSIPSGCNVTLLIPEINKQSLKMIEELKDLFNFEKKDTEPLMYKYVNDQQKQLIQNYQSEASINHVFGVLSLCIG